MKPLAGSVLLFALALASAGAAAATGTVTHLVGTLSVKKADGTVRLLSQKSRIESGDTVTTERDSFAQIEFADGARLTLRPGTAVTIERFAFAEEKPQEDAFEYRLLRGGLRAVAGAVAERSSDRYLVRTATADIGMRAPATRRDAGGEGLVRVGPKDAQPREFGTIWIEDCASTRSGECARMDAAVVVTATDGEAVIRTAQADLGVAAGQSAAVSLNQRPIFLTSDPGLQFTPPASFIQSIMSGSVVNLGRSLECVVAR